MDDIFTSDCFMSENFGAKFKSPIELVAGIEECPMELQNEEAIILRFIRTGMSCRRMLQEAWR